MRRICHALATTMLLLVLASCNTTDALTPQAEIPGATNTVDKSPSQTNLVDTQADVPVDPSMNAADQTTTDLRPPQNTLEAQAQAIDGGKRNPALTDPGDNPELGANLYKNTEAQPAKNLYASNQTAAAATGTIRFLPIIGAPVQAVTPLSRELGNSARANGLTIKSSQDQTAEHVLKGYLSAFSDGKNVTVVYVWDVLDSAGGRLHRIQGQETAPGAAADAWTAVPPEMMQEIGVATIAEYLKWKASKG